MKIGVIVQARMTSNRFPGKTLYCIAGKPLLQYVLERVAQSVLAENVVVATSREESDDPIARFCVSFGVSCYRGPLNDVAGRFKEALDEYRFDAFARVCGDSPLIDQQLIDRAVHFFRNKDVDLVTNVLPRSFPKGQSIEVLSSEVFREYYSNMNDEEDREHVTRYFHTHKEFFRIYNFTAQEDNSAFQLSVDTRRDMEMFSRIIGHMERPHIDYHFNEVLSILRRLRSCKI